MRPLATFVACFAAARAEAYEVWWERPAGKCQYGLTRRAYGASRVSTAISICAGENSHVAPGVKRRLSGSWGRLCIFSL